MQNRISMALTLSLAFVATGCAVGGGDHRVKAAQAAPSNTQTTQTHTISAYSMDVPDRQYNSRTRVINTGTSREVADTSSSRGRYGVTIQDIERGVRNGSAAFVDARGSQAFARGHVRGAYSMPSGHEDESIERFMQEVGPDHPVIVYCTGAFCPAADHVCDYLNRRGFTNVRVFKQGWAALERDEQVK